MRVPRTVALVVGGLALTITAACGSSDPGAPSAAPPPTTSTASDANEEFGPACASVPKDGAGSFAGMAQDSVATAASNNPVLSTLVTAVQQAGLVDTLNSAKGITVFAPTNDAFAKIPKDALDKVLADKDMLTKILTYHVVGSTITPADLASGRFETLQMGTVTTSGSGETFMVNNANVVCGNVKTANATVYIIDTVLMPLPEHHPPQPRLPLVHPSEREPLPFTPQWTVQPLQPAPAPASKRLGDRPDCWA